MSQNTRTSNGRCSQSAAMDVRKNLCLEFDYRQMTDSELLKEFVETQSDRAMAEFVSRHSAKVLTVCRTINADRNDVDDAYQATFLAAIINARKLETVESHGGWLCRVAYNASLKVKKTKQRMVSAGARIQIDSQPDPVPETWEIIEQREAVHQLLHELFRLPKDYQDCLLLAYFEDLSRSEIAIRMGKSESSVKALLQRGRKLLKSRMLRRGVAPMVAFNGIGICVSSTANAGDRILTTIQNCHAWIQTGSSGIPPNVLTLSQTATSVVRITLISFQVTAIAASIVSLGLVGLATVNSTNLEDPSFKLTLAEVQQNGFPENQFQAQIVTDDELPIRILASNLQTEINRDTARLKKLAEWIHHKQGFIEDSIDEQEARMLEQIVDELEVESNEIQERLATNEDRMNEINSKLDE